MFNQITRTPVGATQRPLYQIGQFREQNISNNRGNGGDPPLSGIKAVQQHMKQWVQAHHRVPNISQRTQSDALRLEQAILTDALTFLELWARKHQQPGIQESFIPALKQALTDTRINFNQVVQAGAQLLNLPKPPDFTDWIHQHPNFKSDPVLRTELDMFVNRGNFVWRNYGGSEFKNFLTSPSWEKLNDNSKINCWEAVLYSLMRAGAVSRADLARLYTSSSYTDTVLSNISKAFRWETSKHIVDKNLYLKAAAFNPYFIEVSSRGDLFAQGLDHDFVSFPGSTAKILQTLVSGANQGKPDQSPTFYSHWCTWTDFRVGNPDNREALDYMMNKQTHIIPLPVLIRLFPRISQRAQQLNLQSKP